ncbi:MAG: hypothetical protein AAF466_09310, partial [Bacteroidota bacterium]
GDWDFYITDNELPPNPIGNVLYLGDPSGGLSENVCDVAGVCSETSWPCNFADFDRDGWTDLWVGTVVNQDEFIYLNNNGDGTFTKPTTS